ncbi:phage holin family protein [Ruminococcus sp.]|jgi:toxin secretion/phage lysis holin|uniref:phage holin family protein n=1 Tax=Ruminococcus sp. TaxID=41978 RepID=UPI002056AF8B|nr:MAG TPA: holin [Caudoviricetes sp.]
MKDNIIQATVSVALGALAAYFNVLLVPLTILIVVMIIDYATGMTSAWKSGKLESKTGLIGILKKVSYLVLVAVGGVVDYLISAGLAAANVEISITYCCGLIVCVWLIINELISILENLSELGTPIPKFLVNIVRRLKNTVESKTDSETNKKE